MDVVVRNERPGDQEAISQMTCDAFRSHAHSDQTEHLIIDALRNAGALTLSLVAERASEVVGHIAFSPVTISDGSAMWFGLGPVSVSPRHQRQGIGKLLIRTGLAALREKGALGCVLVGEPAYYNPFGFVNDPELMFPGLPPEYFLALPLGPHRARGVVTYHGAFSSGLS
jgi:putative acetyltransferase